MAERKVRVTIKPKSKRQEMLEFLDKTSFSEAFKNMMREIINHCWPEE